MAEFEIDAREVIDSFKKLTGKEMDRAVRNTLQQSANILIRQAKANLRQETKAYNHPNHWNGKRLQDGIKRSKYDKQNEEVKVHILGDYRLRWFELGTQDRYAKKFRGRPMKKRRFLGKYKASHFFRNAQIQTRTRIFEEMESRLSKNIMRIADK